MGNLGLPWSWCLRMEVALTKVNAALFEKLFGIADCKKNSFAIRQAAAISAMQEIIVGFGFTVAEQTR